MGVSGGLGMPSAACSLLQLRWLCTAIPKRTPMLLSRRPSRRPLRNSSASLQTLNASPADYLTGPNLGDKLQVLAGRSPQHLAMIELLVDRILQRLNGRP